MVFPVKTATFLNCLYEVAIILPGNVCGLTLSFVMCSHTVSSVIDHTVIYVHMLVIPV